MRGGSLGQPSRVIGPTKGGHWANANERPSMTLAPDRSLWKSIDPKEGGVIGPIKQGEPPSVGPLGRGVVSRPYKTNPLRHMRDPLRHMPTLSAHGKWRRGCSIIEHFAL